MEHLLALDGRQFETVVVAFLQARGYRDVQRVGGSGDLGVDIVCRDEAGSVVAVQCKRYAPDRPIGSPAIQVFFGMVVRRRAERGIFVTTSRYTSGARKLAQELDIELIDGAVLERHYSAIRDRERRQREERERQERARREQEERLRREASARSHPIPRPADRLAAGLRQPTVTDAQRPSVTDTRPESTANEPEEGEFTTRSAFVYHARLIPSCVGAPAGVLAAFKLWDQQRALAIVALIAVVSWGITLMVYNDDQWAVEKVGIPRVVVHLCRFAWFVAFAGCGAVIHSVEDRGTSWAVAGWIAAIVQCAVLIKYAEVSEAYRYPSKGQGAQSVLMKWDTAQEASALVACGLYLYSVWWS